jgi:hypothetical protein
MSAGARQVGATLAVVVTGALLVAACAGPTEPGVGEVSPSTDGRPGTPAGTAGTDTAIANESLPALTEPLPAEPTRPSAADSSTTSASTTPGRPTRAAAADPEAVRTAAQIDEYVAQAAAFDQVAADAQFPAGLTFAAGGAPGYSRYVFRETSAGVVPTLVEGPIGGAVRCQDEALPCSYAELRELHRTRGPIPPAWGMRRRELATLVDQLGRLEAFAAAHRDVDRACAAGFVSDRIQTPNMGSHFYRVDWIGDGFDPARPEILLYARADGRLPDGPLGQCVDGVWEGEPVVLVGTAFIVPPSVIGDEHPETFAGPLDNWHIHYNLCRGNDRGRDTFVPRAECEAAGGNFSEALGWMIHAWVAPEHDNQLGVFSMWNSSIPPALDAETILADREVRGSDFPPGGEQSLITDFRYDGELTVTPGQPLVFNNVDAVPHTVTAGTPDRPTLDRFDSGLLEPGTNYEVSFDEPGVYSFFCTLHPDMVATVTVED